MISPFLIRTLHWNHVSLLHFTFLISALLFFSLVCKEEEGKEICWRCWGAFDVYFHNDRCLFFCILNLRIKPPFFFFLGNPAERRLLHQTRVQSSLLRHVPLAPLVKGDWKPFGFFTMCAANASLQSSLQRVKWWICLSILRAAVSLVSAPSPVLGDGSLLSWRGCPSVLLDDDPKT